MLDSGGRVGVLPVAMLVMEPDRGLRLAQILRASGFQPLLVPNCLEACRLLASEDPVSVVLTDAILPDGNWRRMVEVAEERQVEAIVCSPMGDTQFWCEVIQSGAYDLLSEPFDPNEVERIVQLAAGRSIRRLPQGRSLQGRFPMVRSAAG